MAVKILKLEEITAYKISSELSDYTWEIVSKWDWFSKRTFGAQFIEATDSIAANIAEGYGRYHRNDKIKFYYNARGSVFESAYWCKKAYKRNLLSEKENDRTLKELRRLPKEINGLISYTKRKLTI
jgi:four helix bundle protein